MHPLQFVVNSMERFFFENKNIIFKYYSVLNFLKPYIGKIFI